MRDVPMRLWVSLWLHLKLFTVLTFFTAIVIWFQLSNRLLANIFLLLASLSALCSKLRGQFAFLASAANPCPFILIIFLYWIRIFINMLPVFRIRMDPFWGAGSGSSSKWKAGSGSASKWIAGSGSASKWKVEALGSFYWMIPIWKKVSGRIRIKFKGRMRIRIRIKVRVLESRPMGSNFMLNF